MRWGAIVAAVFIIFLFAPLIHLIEIGLGLGLGAVVALLAALIFLPAATLAFREEVSPGMGLLAILTGGLLVALFASIATPAYSPERPGVLNIVHYTDLDEKKSRWIAAAADKSAHKPLLAAAPFAPSEDAPYMNRFAAPAPFEDRAVPEVMVLQDERTDAGRVMQVRLAANGAYTTIVQIPEEASPIEVRMGDDVFPFGEDGAQYFICRGRSCDNLEVEVQLGKSDPVTWNIIGTTPGLPPEGSVFLDARPAYLTPVHRGDVTRVEIRREF